MENWGIVLGIAVAAGVGAYFYGRKPTRTARLRQALAAVAAAALSAALASAGMKYLRDSESLPILSDQPAAIDQAMQAIRETPLLGRVLKETPALDARFREALEAELKTPAQVGPPRSYIVGAEVRRDIIAPTLRRANARTVSSTAACGMASTATSTPSGRSSTDGKHARPLISARLGLIR